jgi:general secretion pathway protein K
VTAPTPTRRRQGVVLLVVLFFALLLAATIATFERRASVDAGIAINRDRALQAEALARGGERLGEVLLLEDLRLGAGQKPPDSLQDLWARVGKLDLIDLDDVSLHIEIEDAASRLNLNALAGAGAKQAAAGGAASAAQALGRTQLGGNGAGDAATRRAYLVGFLKRVIKNMPGRPEDKRYDPEALADNLIDWVDADDVRQNGGPEDEPYQRHDPPYRPANRALLSVDELQMVDGFDGRLVNALRPYVTVYPLSGTGGLNLNTAPTWVLYQLTAGSDVSGLTQVKADDVKRLVKDRDQGLLCSTQAQGSDCQSVNELFDGRTIYPPMRDHSDVFRITAVARVVDVERRVEAVVDRGKPPDLLRLSWRVE